MLVDFYCQLEKGENEREKYFMYRKQDRKSKSA